MAGYIGKSQGVTQVDGYNRSEADAEFVNDPNDVITVSGSNVGIGTTSASTIDSANTSGNLVVGSGSGSEGITVYSGSTNLGSLCFADGTTSTATYAGYFTYNHSSNHMEFGTGSTERMRIDNAGRITAPYQPTFSAWNLASGSQYATSVNTWGTADTILNNWSSPKWSVETNVGSCFNTSNGKFTAPVAGKYRIFASTVWWLAAQNTYMVLYKNGTQGSPYATALGSSVYIPTTISRVMTLSANDTVEIGFYIQSSSNLIPGSAYIQFSGELIG